MTAARVRDAFLSAGYTVEGATAFLGDEAWSAIAREERAPALRVLAHKEPSPLGTYLQLFILGNTVVPHPDVPVADLVALGLVRHVGDALEPLVDVRPYGESDVDWFVVSDLAHLALRELEPDHVLGVGGASTTLAHLTPRLQVGRAADIGSGCGVQALHLARHSSHVVATDINQRALWASDLSAALSDLSVETRHGSFLEPIEGEVFDLIASNPPFVISPKAMFEYRDAGLRGDDVGRALVRDLPEHLNNDGIAVLLANWLHITGEDWRDRVQSWAKDNKCDAWIVQRDVQDNAQYVGTWIRDAAADNARVDNQRYMEWLQGLEDLRAHAVGFGWIVLRKTDAARNGSQCIVVEDRTSAPRLPRGAEVVAAMDAHRLLADMDAFALLNTPLAVPEGVVLRSEQHRTATDWFPGMNRIDLVGGWRGPVEIDDVGAAIVRGCDGSTPLGELLDALTEQTGLDSDEVLAGGLLTARALIGEGLLTLGI